MASYRHLARIAVMQALFAYEFRKCDPEKALEHTFKEFSDKIKDDPFALETLKGVIKHKRKIKKTIEENAPQWPYEKIARVDRAILQIGVYELLFSKDVPPVVAIDEAIEVAKSYGDINSSKFINGVLSTVMNKNNKKTCKTSAPSKKK